MGVWSEDRRRHSWHGLGPGATWAAPLHWRGSEKKNLFLLNDFFLYTGIFINRESNLVLEGIAQAFQITKLFARTLA
jgi:hypothetical protein